MAEDRRLRSLFMNKGLTVLCFRFVSYCCATSFFERMHLRIGKDSVALLLQLFLAIQLSLLLRAITASIAASRRNARVHMALGWTLRMKSLDWFTAGTELDEGLLCLRIARWEGRTRLISKTCTTVYNRV